LKKPERRYLPKPQRRAIVLDTVQAADLRRFDLRIFCDDCSHFSASKGLCTFGYPARHTRSEQTAHYNLTGKMALCRAIEID
jgi:hypothetical protein